MNTTEAISETVREYLVRDELPNSGVLCDFDADSGTQISIGLSDPRQSCCTRVEFGIPAKPSKVQEIPGPSFHGAETGRFETLDQTAACRRNCLDRIEKHLAQTNRKAGF